MAKSKTRLKNPPQIQKRCIFCDGTKLTKQHLIPNWIGREFPENQKNHYRAKTEYNFVDGEIQKRALTITKNGTVGGSVIKIVCDNCNSGWISEIENRVKPLVTRLVRSQQSYLNLDEINNLSLWITLLVLIYEYDHPATKVMMKQERDFLYNEMVPFDNVKIYLGRTNNNNPFERRLIHRGYGISKSEELLNSNHKTKMAYGLTVLAIEGFIFMLTYTKQVEYQINHDENDMKNFVQIWPVNDCSTITLNVDELTHDQIISVLFKAPGVIFNGKHMKIFNAEDEFRDGDIINPKNNNRPSEFLKL